MLELKSLHPSQYRQVAEWEWGPQPKGTDWARYEQEMGAPQWTHYGIYSGASFVGCLSLERERNTAAFHVVTAKRQVSSQDLAQVLLKMAGELFSVGYTVLAARIPKGKEKRAAAILALRCGLREWGHTPTLRYFILTKQRFLKNG